MKQIDLVLKKVSLVKIRLITLTVIVYTILLAVLVALIQYYNVWDALSYQGVKGYYYNRAREYLWKFHLSITLLGILVIIYFCVSYLLSSKKEKKIFDEDGPEFRIHLRNEDEVDMVETFIKSNKLNGEFYEPK